VRGELDRGRGGSAAACCVLCLCISSNEPASEEEKRGVGGFAGAERRVEPEAARGPTLGVRVTRIIRVRFFGLLEIRV
jgi:hypothetical protein